ncbi:lactoylglutathione lyase [Pseudobutyrivibrio sp. 49]|nr:lactoylglutathione lyase [Pseudobutyrivibrio sp. 49]SFN85064.1 lactoylglutathione lyase [Pseudobutyrivibrio sp. UC1225]
MIIEHIAMYVNDLDAAKDFFVKYLDGKPNDGYHNFCRKQGACR